MYNKSILHKSQNVFEFVDTVFGHVPRDQQSIDREVE